MGSATHSWRVAEAGLRSSSVDCRQIHGQESRAAFPDLAHLFAQLARQPAEMFIVPGLALLVPGSFGVRTMAALLDENTLLDIDAEGNISAITVEHASERTGVPEFSYEQVTA